jgi:hypothetical protein
MPARLAALRPRSIYDVMAVIGCVAAVGTGTAYAANTVFSTDIVDGEVKHADLAGNSVTSTNIFNGSVLSAEIADGAVGSAEVADGSLTADDLGGNSVNSSEIATDAVGATEIANGAIDSGEVSDDSLLDDDLAASSVGASEITNGAVGNADLANSGVTGAKVANNSLTTADVAGADVNGVISLGAGAVANSRCKSFDITAPGAKANETLVISTRAALPAGLLIYGQRVPADGHGTMTVCNLSGSTMPALTDFPIRTVTFG